LHGRISIVGGSGAEVGLPIIQITESMVNRVTRFSRDVLKETYDRFSQDDATRFTRIFVGKLGELAFSVHLTDLSIEHDTSTMFAVFQGTENVDPFDFVVPRTGEKIDVKTAYRGFHQLIMVPHGPNGQWD
jgi:hypothetical protein